MKGMVSEAAMSSKGLPKKKDKAGTQVGSKETTPSSDREVRWQVVAVAQGLAEAAIIRGRLESEGILARVQQEPAGAAIGLTVGLLGQVKVLVPEPLVDAALELLNGRDEEAMEDSPDPD
jgi:hypothetical protein